jgi:hypothetical protein
MKRRKDRIAKAGDDKSKDKVFRLTDIDPEFVSLVRAGANRQRAFMVVKAEEDVDEAEDPIPEDFDEGQLGEYLTEKFTGSPRNRFGTHSSYKFKGNYAKAWMLHFSQHAQGKPDAVSTGPIRGTVRRVEMIAAAMKPACKLPTTDVIDARGGAESPVSGDYPETPAAYGLSEWDKPKDDADREGMKLSCSDLEVIKRAALAEVKRRAEDAEKNAAAIEDACGGKPKDEDKKGGRKKSDDTEKPPKDATDLASWLSEATEQLEGMSLDIAIQNALDAHAVDKAAPVQPSDPAQEIAVTAAPAVEKGERPEDRERAARLEAELAKARRENLALKAKNARLSAATIGKSSVILTGEVTSRQQKAEKKPQTSPSRGAFNRGGDIAAAVARGEG